MDYQLFSDVVLTCDVGEENLRAGDVGTVFERHEVSGLEVGFSVEYFDMLGNIVDPENSIRHWFEIRW